MEKNTPAKELKKSAKPSEKKTATVKTQIPPSNPAHTPVVKEKPVSAATEKKPVKPTAKPSPKRETKTSTVKKAATLKKSTAKTVKK